jgi:hypothetical protein
MIPPSLISKYFEKVLGVTWFGVALLVLLYAVWRFAGSDLDSRSFALLLVGGVLLLLMGLLIALQLPGRKVLALVMSVIVGFREYMLWAHGFPDAVDIWVVRSALVLVLAVVTLVFYSITKVRQGVP